MKAGARSIAFVLLLAGCGGSAAAPTRAPSRLIHHAETAAPAAPIEGFPSERITFVPSGTYGPYVGDRPEGTIAAWAALTDGKRRWFTTPLGAAHEKEPKAIADSAAEVDLVAVRPLGDASKGFLLLSTSREFSGGRVDALALGPGGELRGGPVPLSQSQGDVVWIDAVPTKSGALAMWAVRREDRAELYAVPVGESGQVRAEPASVLTDVRSWQVAEVQGGVAIAVVAAGKTRDESGPVRVQFVDENGKPEKRPLVVSGGSTAEPDLDLAAVGDKLVLAWSDDHDIEPRVYGAVVDGRAGTLAKPPAPLGRPFGPQAVLRIVEPFKSGAPAFLAWENALERPPGGRAVRLGRFGDDGALGNDAALLFMSVMDGSIPELTASGTGVAALTRALDCKRGAACDSTDVVPTFVEFDGSLAVSTSAPVRLSALDGGAADLAWGLTCREQNCFALADALKTPAPIFAVRLGATSSNAWEPAGRKVTATVPPRADSIEAIGKSDSVADLASARMPNGSLTAWVSYFDPTTPFTRSPKAAPDGKYEPARAVVRVRATPDKGDAPEPVAISYRAFSQGGIAVAPGDPARSEALVVWAGVDNKEPQVFATLVGADGKKQSQKMLTHTKGGVADVAAEFTGDGFVVGWIDERSGESQAYVTKIDRTLRPMTPEKHLGSSASTATGIRLLSRGDHVFAVWSDARGPARGVADIFSARLAAKDLSPIGPERSLATTAGHSESPAIAAFGEGAVVAWVEDPPPGVDGALATVMVAQLDSGGEPVMSSVANVPLEGSAESVGLTCGNTGCRIGASVTTSEGGTLEAFEWRPGAESHPRRLVGLTAKPRDSVAPEPLGNEIFYADESAQAAYVRRMSVTW